MSKSIVRLYKESFKDPRDWADLLKNFNYLEDTEYVDFLPLREEEEEEITEQIIEQVEGFENG